METSHISLNPINPQPSRDYHHLDNNLEETSYSGAVTPDSNRFRVNRIDSIKSGYHKGDQDTSSNSSNNKVKRKTSVTFEDLSPEKNRDYQDYRDLESLSTSTNKRDLSNIAEDTDSVNTSQIEKEELSRVESFSDRVRRMSTNGIMGPLRKLSQQMRRKSSLLPDIDEFHQQHGTVGVYGKSLANYTHDALPKLDNYRNLMSIQANHRPTMDELHDPAYKSPEKRAQEREDIEEVKVTKFGWIEGCLVRCLLNIWGVMLFLRLSWMVAHAGLIHAMIIITISTVVTTITTLSMSAVSTNGEIKGGGLYYMISRSLGPEFGGAVGVVFSFANSGMAALNTVGFSESVIALLAANGLAITGHVQNDNRIISCTALVIMQAIICISMAWEAKVQMALLVVLLVAMGDFVIGAFMGPQYDIQTAKGFIGLNGTLFLQNLQPGYRFSEGQQQDFFTIFSIFFPAVAGIQAGASISGDLRDPGEAIPKGTLLAIFITSASYAAFALLAGAGTLREASGNVTEIADWSFDDCANRTCKWGLYNDFQVMELMSIFGPLIYAGCFAATISSALSCLVSGPKTFQALCKDKVYPYLTRFGIGYRASDDPYWSYAIGFVVALIFILIADLNAIAPLISNFFMAAYALLNYCTFHAGLVRPLGWRPTFKYYNKWLSLAGAIMCLIVMFLMSWITALISLVCTITLYLVVVYRKPDVNWGTSTQAQTYTDALNALQDLASQNEHVKNYRPQILLLTGHPSSRPTLVDFAYLLTKKTSLLICANICEKPMSPRNRRSIIDNGYIWLRDRKMKAFYVTVDNCKFAEGSKTLLQSTGIGKLSPNVLLMGFKHDWKTCERAEIVEYFLALHEGLDNYLSIAILRVKDGLDCSHLVGSSIDPSYLDVDDGMHRVQSAASMDYESDTGAAVENNTGGGKENLAYECETGNGDVSADAVKKGNKIIFNGSGGKKKSDDDFIGKYRGPDDSDFPRDIVTNLSLFQLKQGKGVIDVWWLYDDGGLTLLLPYIIQTRKNWEACKLRVFTLANRKAEMEVEQRSMASLLSKFRIDYSDLTVIPDITRRADQSTKNEFEALIKEFKGEPDENSEYAESAVISDTELLTLKEKTNRHMRLRELLLEHSTKSNLIVMTLPVPRKSTVSAPLYMAWLEIMSRDMPPFLFVRGNQQSVLTFYS